MAKKAKGNRIQVILECTEHKGTGASRNFSLHHKLKTKKILQTD